MKGTRRDTGFADGILVAPLDGDPWSAVQALRRGMRAAGGPELAFLFSLDDEGRMVSSCDPRAVVLLLGFRHREAAA
jgi:hypothetical protein